jgi:hypothetical protein
MMSDIISTPPSVPATQPYGVPSAGGSLPQTTSYTPPISPASVPGTWEFTPPEKPFIPTVISWEDILKRPNISPNIGVIKTVPFGPPEKIETAGERWPSAFDNSANHSLNYGSLSEAAQKVLFAELASQMGARYDILYFTRWNWDDPVGTPVTLTYSFIESGALPNYYSATSSDSTAGKLSSAYSGFNQAQKEALASILALYEKFAGVTFVPATDGVGQLTFANSSGFAPPKNGLVTTAQVMLPGTATDPADLVGDVWVNSRFEDGSWEPGSYNYLTLFHEVGHALGLAHPHNTGLTPESFIEDVIQYTIMAYPAPGELYPASPMPLDIEALQFLYGTPTDTRFVLPDPDTPYWYSIWPLTTGDVDFSNLNLDWDIHLGPQTDVWDHKSDPAITGGGLKIWLLHEGLNYVKVGSGNDRLTIDPSLFASPPSFYLDGGAGNDRYVFENLTGQYLYATINDVSGTDIIRFDANISQITHAGSDLLLDWNGGQVRIDDFYAGHVLEGVLFGDNPNAQVGIALVGLLDTLGDGQSITDFSSLIV